MVDDDTKAIAGVEKSAQSAGTGEVDTDLGFSMKVNTEGAMHSFS